MKPRQPALRGKVPNPTSLLTSTDEERFYARSVEWRGVHFCFMTMLRIWLREIPKYM